MGRQLLPQSYTPIASDCSAGRTVIAELRTAVWLAVTSRGGARLVLQHSQVTLVIAQLMQFVVRRTHLATEIELRRWSQPHWRRVPS